jgi:hypothetical protein
MYTAALAALGVAAGYRTEIGMRAYPALPADAYTA